MDNDFYPGFGRNLREARRKAGLSQGDLALSIRLTRASVSNIEQGRQKVLLHTFWEMLDVLNTQPGDLLPSAKTQPASSLSGLRSDEIEFVRRGLREMSKPYKEEHVSSLDADSENGKRVAGGT